MKLLFLLADVSGLVCAASPRGRGSPALRGFAFPRQRAAGVTQPLRGRRWEPAGCCVCRSFLFDLNFTAFSESLFCDNLAKTNSCKTSAKGDLTSNSPHFGELPARAVTTLCRPVFHCAKLWSMRSAEVWLSTDLSSFSSELWHAWGLAAPFPLQHPGCIRCTRMRSTGATCRLAPLVPFSLCM